MLRTIRVSYLGRITPGFILVTFACIFPFWNWFRDSGPVLAYSYWYCFCNVTDVLFNLVPFWNYRIVAIRK